MLLGDARDAMPRGKIGQTENLGRIDARSTLVCRVALDPTCHAFDNDDETMHGHSLSQVSDAVASMMAMQSCSVAPVATTAPRFKTR